MKTERSNTHALQEDTNLVKIWYFKPSGKYYTEGNYVTEKENAYEIFDEVKAMFKNGVAPGLTQNDPDFTAVVFPLKHYPAMIRCDQ